MEDENLGVVVEGTFLSPGNTLNAGSGGNLFVVPKNSANKQLAYEFINDTLQPDVQKLLANNGAVPISTSTAGVTNPLNVQLIHNFQILAGNNGLAYYPDWPTLASAALGPAVPGPGPAPT